MQRSASEQSVPAGFGVAVMPFAGSHEYVVQTVSAGRASVVPGAQEPAPSQDSEPLQTFASLHGVPDGAGK